ncbi:MAG: sulfurtransferase complex subunit TusB [Thermodesulfovibrionales bacterium]|nr:sulfurtransferase complex subunit TusB [Thermodesulfovibrionales bacterium]
MKLGVFLSDYRTDTSILERLSPQKLGIILVGNGVYHAAIKEKGQASNVLNMKANFYVLKEDLETRGLSVSNLDSRVKPVTYSDVVDLIFNEYEKLIWM